MRTISTDVLIVGAGPCGLTASAFLAKYGVKALTVSRYRGTAHTPRAHITNIRTVEVFRDLGIQHEIEAVSEPLSYLCHNVFGVSLAGTEIARFKSYGSGSDRLSDYAQASPCKPLNTPQHVMEPVLLKAARDLGAEVQFSKEVVRIEQTTDRALAWIRDRETGDEFAVSARYVIGADGGRSTVAEQLGIEFQGEAGLLSMVNLWVDADLRSYTSHRPGVLYHTLQPPGAAGNGTWVCVKPWSDWIFVSVGSPEAPEAELVARAKASIGDPNVEIRVKNISGWQVNHLFATEYRRGRVFVAGDAAHRHPPAGGLGTNTSVQDAFNLAWKLAFVLNGKAGDKLLDTYHDERQPVGRAVVERAIKSLHNVAPIPRALGFRAGQTSEEGWALLDTLFTDAPEAADRRAALRAAVKLQNYRANALGVELGQQYRSTAVMQDGSPYPAPVKDPELYYQATSHPGCCLPHAWVQRGTDQISTLDVVGHGGLSLIVGMNPTPWRAAAAEVGAELDVALEVHSIGARCEFDDVLGDWTLLREVEESGALLVRPDRFIAWRCQEAPGNRVESLRAALKAILAIQEPATIV